MSDFLDILPLIFYGIAGIICITYQTIYEFYKLKISKKTDIIFLSLVIFFGTLSIISSILFWLCY